MLGVTPAELSPVIGMLYRRRLADRCGPYIVAVPPPLPSPGKRNLRNLRNPRRSARVHRVP